MKKTVMILSLGAALMVFGCGDDETNGAGAGGTGTAGSGGTGTAGAGGDGMAGSGGDGMAGSGGTPVGGKSGTTEWVAESSPAGSNGGPTATADGCEVFVTALNTTIYLQVTLTLDVAADAADNVTTGWQIDAQHFLLPTLGAAAELGALTIAAQVTDGTGGPIDSELTAAATGQLIGGFITGDTLTLASPADITEGSAAVTADGGAGSTYNVNWDGNFALDLTLGGNPLVTVDQDVCTFNVQGDGVDITAG